MFARHLKLHGDALTEVFRSGGCSKAGRRQPPHVPAPTPTCSAGRKPGKDSGSCRHPPDLPQAFLQAGSPPDTEALAASNLKGFANTSMVLSETNIRRSAPCSERTSSGKDRVCPAASDTVSRQPCRSCLAAGSLLPQPCPRRGARVPATGPQPPWDHAAGGEEGGGCSRRAPHHRNAPCGGSTQAGQRHGRLLWAPSAASPCSHQYLHGLQSSTRDHCAARRIQGRTMSHFLSLLLQPPA